ncbi:MAG TPA: YihY/virulence factor BrkB family protein [Bacteroidales bacterium]|nr:YihY/virulence factor BrkB family protein [Bacteroidales bacterium]HNX83198.1 YihY/virulence factor BrkB family protein [Bacteroidales bacterium]HOC47429.1 YihY/virulence factor BrkB family protein [Bacteroidales bacterium]
MRPVGEISQSIVSRAVQGRKAVAERLKKSVPFWIRQRRIIYLLYKGIKRENIYIKASALTFFTILSVIPMVALAFGIAKGFGLSDELRAQIIMQFHNQEQVMNWILDFANKTLEQTSGGWLAGIGVAFLFSTVGQLLRYVENTFNSIWKVDETRVWYRQVTDYLAVIILVPALFVASSSATVLATTRLNDMLSQSDMLEGLKPVVSFLVQLIPFILLCTLSTAAFLAMPNTRVKFRSALVAGLAAGIALQILQIVYVETQMGLTRLGTLYGSFAAIPLLMVWVQMSWVVLLMGAQLSYYLQNITRYEFEFDVQTVSPRQKKRLSLLVMHSLIVDFVKGAKPRAPEQISMELSLPVRTVHECLDLLHEASMVTEVWNEEQEKYVYQPATDINKMTLSFVLEKLESSGSLHKIVINNSDYRKIDTALTRFESLVASSEVNILLRNL